MFEEPSVYFTISMVVASVYGVISSIQIAKRDINSHMKMLASYRLFYIISPIIIVFLAGFLHGLGVFLILFFVPLIIVSIGYYIKK